MIIASALLAASIIKTTIPQLQGTRQALDPAVHTYPYPEVIPPPPHASNEATAESLPAVQSSAAQQQTWLATIGLVRTLPRALSAESITPSAGTWQATIVSTGAAFLRLRIHNVPPALRFWVCGTSDCSNVFYSDQAYDGLLWSPIVRGDRITLITDAPHPTFDIDAVAHIFSLSASPDSTTCFIDAVCEPPVATYRSAVAQLTFISGNNVALCTGGLLADRAKLFPPYLLTANHCISTPAEAASLTATFDDAPTSCGGAAPVATALPHTNGATILATSAATDVTLLRLNQNAPGTRTYLGWNPNAVAVGTTLLRVSHPATVDATLVYTQTYSTTVVDSQPASCAAQRPEFIYSQPQSGGAGPGSSGAPSFDSTGHVIGQLLGGCGPSPSDGCASSTRVVDGAFSQSYPSLAPFLEDGSPAQSPCIACTPSANVACLLANRFKATIQWNDFGANLSGPGSLVRYADNQPEVDPQFGPVSETAFFSFYSFAPKSIEVFVRMLNGHGINDKYWIFAGGFTGAQYTLSVQDTKTCATWQQTIASGATNVVKDLSAFPLP